jgi:tetratricopeptide (TPR) repeat protein
MASLLLKYNQLAMVHLSNEAFTDCRDLLKKAEDLLLNACDDDVIRDLPNRSKLLGLTYNNFACFYKRRRQPNVALGYLKKALEAEARNDSEPADMAGTHLNICAVYSQLGKHQEALEDAQIALGLLKTAFNEGAEDSSVLSSIAVAYHNIAAELEHLNMLEQAVAVYSSGLVFAKQHLGEEHSLTESLENSYKTAGDRARQLVEMKSRRRSQRDRENLGGNRRALKKVQLPKLLKPYSQPVRDKTSRQHRPKSEARSLNTSAYSDLKVTLKDRQVLEESAAWTRRRGEPSLRMSLRPYLRNP